ncbi:carboxypeptidase regulatory-like domain-containing protein [Aliifodinibius salicampi]|uniref:Carboxypeptidase regulatory-like domain-containing protein n=1 Tax=Fodinibius salicampi TaxID=1920655 RepID=A0ABT3PV78_9BACT|nr:carboxypeptidase regulatory-like domain-containing protein [Fodinibius salicampi]MCW9711760.1 carboxypeptidase regulatory-like domain-containing protein [Fodinibius salicampi]
MRKIQLVLLTLVSLFFIQSCDYFKSKPAVVGGEVIEASSENAVEGATVEIIQPENFQQSTITNSSGRFSFDVEPDDGSVALTLEVTKEGYQSATRNVEVSSNDEINDLVIELTAEGDDGNGDGDNGGGDQNGETVGAAAIVLTDQPEGAININETGDQVSTSMTFQVQDSLGRALSSNNAVEVSFSIINGPGGGEDLVPATATTNSSGNVTTTLFSGNTAGEIKVQALVNRDDGIEIKSSPIVVAIHGGFPDQDHFSIAAENFNFEGWDINNNRNVISTVVGDKFSNPVKPGTVVYFETTGGVIQGSGQTDEDGIVEVDLISGNPRPTNGMATITASTKGENGEDITQEIPIVFSSRTAYISASPTSFDLDPDGGASFNYTVQDVNGNPMAKGTQISIEAGAGIELTGDTNFTLGDHITPGAGATNFSFSIRDTDDESDEAASLTLKISVTTPSGNTTTYSGISGTRR